MTDQKNDNTFFNLLENHRQLVQSFTKGEFKYEFSKGGLGKGKWKAATEAVSGYDVLKQIADSWEKYFKEYNRCYNAKLIDNISLQEFRDPFGLIESDPITFTFTRELLHLHKFINQRFKTEAEQYFYKETLTLSLTDQEKFIFEAMYELFPNERNGVTINPSFYLDHHFVDFKTCQLPEFEIEYKYESDSVEKFKIFVEHYGHLTKSEFIIYENHLPHEIKIKERLPAVIEETNEYRKGVIYLLHCLGKSSLKDWSTKPARYLESKKFAIHLHLDYNNEKISILFGIDFSCSERFSPEQNKLTELTNVGIRNLDPTLANNMNHLISELNLLSD